MEKVFVKDAFGWGFVLWLIGYILGILLFFFVPKDLIGWIITPVGIIITLWVLSHKISDGGFRRFLHLASVWTLLAILLDYVFNVKLFNIGSSYYRLDVYLYYLITFLLPLAFSYHEKASE